MVKNLKLKAAEILIYKKYKIKTIGLYFDRLPVANVISKGFLKKLFST